MQIILFFFLLIFIIVLPIVFFISRVFGLFFQSKTKRNNQAGKTNETTYSQSTQNKKVFEKSEGEYVDFEEVTDENNKQQ